MATFVASLCFTILIWSATAESLEDGFTVELIHRSSPKSPLYNPLETLSQRMDNALRRSITHLAGFGPNAKRFPSLDITNIGGEYLMDITIGTPPVRIVGLADTGSDLIWTQCDPCYSCFPQDAQLFKPSQSGTYVPILSGSDQCQKLDDITLPSSQGSPCQYEVIYEDNSFTRGNLALDTIRLGSTTGQPIKFPNMVVGCGYNNGGLFYSYMSGIVGLGGGDASLISQIGRRSGGKFSYCLVPYVSDSSKLNFGSNAKVTGQGVVSTPLVQKSPKTYYHVTLEGITVNRRRFMISGSSERGAYEGNMMIDSGAMLTSLAPNLYDRMEHAVSSAIHLPRIDGQHDYLSLCYESSGLINNPPQITMHFTGADLVLYWYNTFVHVNENVACFSFIRSTSDLSIFGSTGQIHILVGIDLQERKVSFKPTDCTAA